VPSYNEVLVPAFAIVLPECRHRRNTGKITFGLSPNEGDVKRSTPKNSKIFLKIPGKSLI
jgi:hypothetical protein